MPAGPGPLEVRVVARGRTPVIALSGELDIATAEAVRHAVAPLLHDADELVVDATELVFADATGLSALLGPAHELKARNGRLVIRNPTRIVRRVLDLLDLDDFAIE